MPFIKVDSTNVIFLNQAKNRYHRKKFVDSLLGSGVGFRTVSEVISYSYEMQEFKEYYSSGIYFPKEKYGGHILIPTFLKRTDKNGIEPEKWVPCMVYAAFNKEQRDVPLIDDGKIIIGGCFYFFEFNPSHRKHLLADTKYEHVIENSNDVGDFHFKRGKFAPQKPLLEVPVLDKLRNFLKRWKSSYEGITSEDLFEKINRPNSKEDHLLKKRRVLDLVLDKLGFDEERAKMMANKYMDGIYPAVPDVLEFLSVEFQPEIRIADIQDLLNEATSL